MKELFKIGLPLLLLAFALLFYTYKQIDPAPEKKLTIAAGRVSGVYYQYAKSYKALLEQEGIAVTIEETAGSAEVLELLRAKKIDIGFVQGGVATQEDRLNLKSLGSIYIEPVWFFYRASLGMKEYLNDFRDINISIGEQGSGTMVLISQLLAQTDIAISDKHVQKMGAKESYVALKQGQIDAFFTVISSRSELVKEILSDPAVAHLELKRIDAYAENYAFLQSYQISEGSLDLKENIPFKDTKLLATTATLVTHSDVDSLLIRLMTIIAKQYAGENADFPSGKNLEIPIHEASDRYLNNGNSFLEKFLPFWVASNINRLKYLLIPLLTLFLPLFKGFLPLYRWRWRSKIYRWYADVDSISKDWENFAEEKLERALTKLDELMIDIKSTTDVPLTFKGEYYTLEMHIDNVVERINRKLKGSYESSQNKETTPILKPTH